MAIAKTKAEIVEIAKKHGGRYLLPRRFHYNPWAHKEPLDLEYDACGELTLEGKASWLPMGTSYECGPGPGICLTSKAFVEN